MREVIHYIGKKQFVKILLISFVSICITLIEIAITFIFKNTMDIRSYEEIYRFLDYIPLLLLFITLFAIGKFVVSDTCINMAVHVVEQDKIRLSKHVQNLSLSSIKKYTVGELYTSIHENMLRVEDFLRIFPIAIAAPLILCMTLATMASYSIKLTFVCVFLIPIPTILFQVLNQPIRKKSQQNIENISRVNNFLKCSLEGIDLIKTYDLYTIFAKKFYHLVSKVKDKDIEIEKTKRNTNPFMFFLRIFPQCFIPIYGGYLAMKGEISIGLLPAFSILIGNIFIPIETLLNTSTKLRIMIAAILKLKELDELKEERVGGNVPIVDSEIVVLFEHVKFAYKDSNVLNDISFSVKKNGLIALVGESGSGKSTITKLIAGLYENYTGSVQVFGQELNEIDLKKLRKETAVLSQNPFLLNGTIRENLLYGVDTCTEQEIQEAISFTNLNDVLNQLSLGLDTQLTEKGMNLSKGQRQRIALARVILRKSPLIIIDEATSGLDPASVEIIKQSLAVLKNYHTIIMVTHDIMLASNADQIIVLHNHCIEGIGGHEELMENTVYHSMYINQQGGEVVR